MPLEITLIIHDPEQGTTERVAVDTKIFTIGRSPDNDLVINDTDISRRHAVIENYGRAARISDCGSQNGTELNGEQVTAAHELSDGDRILLGGSYSVDVRFAKLSNATRGGSQQQYERDDPNAFQSRYGAASGNSANDGAAALLTTSPNAQARRHLPRPAKQDASRSVWLSVPVLAGGGALLLVLVTIALVFFIVSQNRPTDSRTRRRRPRPTPTVTNTNDQIVDDGTNNATLNSNGTTGDVAQNTTPDAGDGGTTTADNGSNDSNASSGGTTHDKLEAAATRFIRQITPDASPYAFSSEIAEQTLAEIDKRVKELSSNAGVRTGLQRLQSSKAEIASGASEKGFKPALVAFAALAESGGGDVTATARGMLPTLLTLRATIGYETADDGLMLVAAYKYPYRPPTSGQARAAHPLIERSREMAKRSSESPAKFRNVWLLHKYGALTNEAYDYVLRFVALGVIAQNPKEYGIEVAPFAF